jgi:hypothetical protein
MDKKFIKLTELDGETITIEKIWGFKWKLWDQVERKMLIADSWQKDYKKRYSIETDKGSLEVSQNQMGKILEATMTNGIADPVGKTLQIRSNGRQGLQADYWFNLVQPQQEVLDVPEDWA